MNTLNICSGAVRTAALLAGLSFALSTGVYAADPGKDRPAETSQNDLTSGASVPEVLKKAVASPVTAATGYTVQWVTDLEHLPAQDSEFDAVEYLQATHIKLAGLPVDAELVRSLAEYVAHKAPAAGAKRDAALKVPVLDAWMAKAGETEESASPTTAVAYTDALGAINDAISMGGESQTEAFAYADAGAPLQTAAVPATLPAAPEVSDEERECLATAIYFEARGEPYRGQVAVAQVVMNRVADKRYPDTICDVVFQNDHRRNACQFSFACDGQPETISDKKSWKRAEEIAAAVTSGDLVLPEIAGATHYHATYVSPFWAPKLERLAKVGLHVFYE